MFTLTLSLSQQARENIALPYAIGIISEVTAFLQEFSEALDKPLFSIGENYEFSRVQSTAGAGIVSEKSREFSEALNKPLF